MVRVLFVCLGNICRSPTAEGALLRLVADAGLRDVVHVDSAGTGGWHVGDPPDPRTIRAAARRGFDLKALRARQVQVTDFATFDHVLAMDDANLVELRRLCPDAHAAKLRLFMERPVPDPYSGGAAGFEHVLDLCEEGGRALLDELVARHGLARV